MPIFGSPESAMQYARDFEAAYPKAVDDLFQEVINSIEFISMKRKLDWKKGFDIQEIGKEIKHNLHTRKDIKEIINYVPDPNGSLGPCHAYYDALDNLTEYILKHITEHKKCPKKGDALIDLKPYQPHWVAIE